MINRNKKNSGFTIIEIAISFVIATFIFIPLMSIIVQRDKERSEATENDYSDRIVASLSMYLRQNGYYPCPADPTLEPGNANFGREMRAGITCNVAAPVTAPPSTKNVYIGALPVTDLGLPYYVAANKKNWKYIYAITGDLTDPTTFDGEGGIEVENDFGNPSDTVPFIVVNPGEDGKGAYTISGGLSNISCLAASNQAKDKENCDYDDAVFLDGATNVKDTPTAIDYFDDKLAYNTISKKSSHWVITKNLQTAGKIEISNRNGGNIGVGLTSTPTNKLHIRDAAGGTAMRVEADYTGKGGKVEAQDNITVADTLNAENITGTNNTIFRTNNFCMGEAMSSGAGYACCLGEIWNDPSTAASEDCCTQNVYTDLAAGGNKVCGNACTEDILDNDGDCCSKYEVDSSGQCCTGSSVLDANGSCCFASAMIGGYCP